MAQAIYFLKLPPRAAALSSNSNASFTAPLSTVNLFLTPASIWHCNVDWGASWSLGDWGRGE